jgi:hypothetical protein
MVGSPAKILSTLFIISYIRYEIGIGGEGAGWDFEDPIPYDINLAYIRYDIIRYDIIDCILQS